MFIIFAFVEILWRLVGGLLVDLFRLKIFVAMRKGRSISGGDHTAVTSLLSNDHLTQSNHIAQETVVSEGIQGLTSAQVEELYEKWGYNELPSVVIPLWYIFLTQFTGTMPYMLEVIAFTHLLLS
jgi:hypothetical protein